MIDSLPSLSPTAGIASAPVAASIGSGAPTGGTDPTPDKGAGAAMPSFGQTLGQFLDARDATLDRSALPPTPGDGQESAADGKDLPAAKDDDGKPVSAMPPIWFPAGVAPLPVVAPAPLTTAVPVAPPATPGSPNVALSAALGAGVTNGAAPTPSDVPPGLTAHTVATSLVAAQTPAPVTTTQTALVPSPLATQAIVADANTTPRAAPAPSLASATADARPDSPISVTTAPQPAGQVFAAAIATASSWRDRAKRDPDGDTATIATTTPIALQERAVIHAAGDAQGSALDLTKDSGLQRMVDHIESLRDGADAGDTRVRLTPDALGSVDVAVRQEGDRVHVRFTAAQDATRALIADAQPRLTELAAARGVRIGETSVGGGSAQTASGNTSDPQPRPAPQPGRAPRSAAPDATTITIDQRLA